MFNLPADLRFPRRALAALTLALVAGCTTPDSPLPPGQVFDPYEAGNRKTHAFNRKLDKALLKPASEGYAGAIPVDIRTAIGRFAENLSMPQAIVNGVLQGNMKGATEDTYRFLVNTTVGLGGFFDPATEMGMPSGTGTDFGETLDVWGVPQGAYLELPVLGPSTERAATGRIVDLFTDPLGYALPRPERYYSTGVSVLDGIGKRGRYSETINSILYESADSYAASRSVYLQNRGFRLGRGTEEDYVDPYDMQFSDP